MDFELILGFALFLSGVFLLTTAILSYLGNFSSSGIVSASNPFLAEVLIGFFLIAFGLYLMKIFLPVNRKYFL